MKYSEIFYSIQGEGQLVGLPSVFFRTSYCNLRCIWCDTPYTSWQPENKDIALQPFFLIWLIALIVGMVYLPLI